METEPLPPQSKHSYRSGWRYITRQSGHDWIVGRVPMTIVNSEEIDLFGARCNIDDKSRLRVLLKILLFQSQN
jgi:hypothetical protein